jgi:hypothetical protein
MTDAAYKPVSILHRSQAVSMIVPQNIRITDCADGLAAKKYAGL